MAYTKHKWVSGEVITKDLLNHMEDGIEGNKPVKGVDYFTDADITDVANKVIALLPNGDEVSY